MNLSSVILIAFFTSVLSAAGTLFVVERTNLLAPAEEQQIAVPNLKGLSEDDAMINLRAVGLVLSIGSREPSPDAKPGTILRQALPVGQTVPKGHTITVTLAEELPKVPDVTGQGLQEATLLLDQAGYRVQKGDGIADDRVPEGKVVKQAPSAGSALEANKTVLVHLSTGANTVEIPKVVGLTLSNAKAQLEKVGLEVGPLRWVYADEAGYMAVLNQDPPAGSKVKPGTPIILSVNRD